MSPQQAMFVATQWAALDADGIVRIRADPAHKMPNAVQYRRAEAMACWDKAEAQVLLVLGAETDFTGAVKSWIDPDASKHPFRGAPTASIPSAGHMVHFEAPTALAKAIEDFLLKA
jgi:pimeloyl-ACP methyl ester carboxylesterase